MYRYFCKENHYSKLDFNSNKLCIFTKHKETDNQECFRFWMEFECLLNHGNSFRKNTSSVSAKLIQLCDLTLYGFCLCFIPKTLILFSFGPQCSLCQFYTWYIFVLWAPLWGRIVLLEKVKFVCHWINSTN